MLPKTGITRPASFRPEKRLVFGISARALSGAVSISARSGFAFACQLLVSTLLARGRMCGLRSVNAAASIALEYEAMSFSEPGTWGRV
jgi:hypothetical protein